MTETRDPQVRTVVVTGTSGALGRAVAERLVTHGHRVVGIARRDVDPQDVGEGYHHVRADLSELDTLPDLARQITRSHGTPYALVNNAAGAGAVRQGLPMVSDERVRRAIELDLVSPMLLAKHFSRSMVAAGTGRIVNITSISASGGHPGMSVYSAAKAGLEGFTRSLARDLGGRGVTVNCVAPGFLRTAMTDGLTERQYAEVQDRIPLRRLVTLEEVAAAVTYFLGDDAAGVTGTVLTVDAGESA